MSAIRLVGGPFDGQDAEISEPPPGLWVAWCENCADAHWSAVRFDGSVLYIWGPLKDGVRTYIFGDLDPDGPPGSRHEDRELQPA